MGAWVGRGWEGGCGVGCLGGFVEFHPAVPIPPPPHPALASSPHPSVIPHPPPPPPPPPLFIRTAILGSEKVSLRPGLFNEQSRIFWKFVVDRLL